MAKTHLLQAVCAVAMLASVPALAQRPEAGATGPNGAPNPEMNQSAAPGNNGANSTSMAPADTSGSPGAMGDHASMDNQSTHRSAMQHPMRGMHGKSEMSQDAAVDQLNDQSLQAARSGQAFNGSSSGGMSSPGAMSNPGASSGGSGSMNDMSGGSMSGNGTTGSGTK